VGWVIATVALVAMTAGGAFMGSGAQAQRGARIGQVAAEITGGPWLNSPPLSLAGLRGRVVLVDFWTYG
jgi:hypothetical protein